MTYDLLSRYLETRSRTTQLTTSLNVEEYNLQAADFTSPPKWHLAHTTWFFEKLILEQFVDNYPVFNAAFDFLFNSYYNSIGDRVKRNRRGLITRPGIEKIYEYRKHVDYHITQLLSSIYADDVRELIILGINHEQQHQELLLSDLKYSFALNPLLPVYDTNLNLVNEGNEETGWLKMSEGIYNIGHQSKNFSFDNELGRHKVYLHDYEISKSLITNGEFIEFIESGGYKKFHFWLDEGWSWVNDNNITNPLYWSQIDGDWFYFTLAGLQPINGNAIVSHISHFEASAFASWKGCRLPTEYEWEAASSIIKWGKRWEWTNSAYLPYPGFKVSEDIIGEYNGKFMINQMVLRGASEATALGHSRNTYRNFFQTNTQWQFTGIRLAR